MPGRLLLQVGDQDVPFFGGGLPRPVTPGQPSSSAVLMNYRAGQDLPAGTVKLEAVTAIGLPVSAVSIRVGHVDSGLLFPCERVGASNLWRMTGTWDTVRQLDPDYSPANYVDQVVYLKAIATTANGTFESPLVHVFTDNTGYRGTTPAYSPAYDFAPNFDSGLDAFRASYRPGRNGSNIYGTEDGALAIVADPGNTSTDGPAHTSFGNVIYSAVPQGYKAQTANRTINGRTYGANGDQAGTGGQRFQAQTPKDMQEGRFAFYGQAWRDDPAMKFPTTSHISRSQVFGDPYEISLVYMLDGQYRGAASTNSDAKLGYYQYWGGRLNPHFPAKAFELPIARGDWVGLVLGMGFSRDPRKGWIEIGYRHPGINAGKLTRHEFFGIPGNYRIPALTLPPIGNSGFAFHAQSYAAEKMHPIRTHFAKMRVAGTMAAADPGGY